MQRIIILMFFSLGLFLNLITTLPLSASMREMVWKSSGSGINDNDMRTMTVDPGNGAIMYVSSGNTVYKSDDSGDSWEEITTFRGTGITIHTIAVRSDTLQSIYICTDNGMYRSADDGTNMEKIFNGVGDDEAVVLSIAFDGDNEGIMHIGTKAGLFFTKNSGKDWERSLSIPSDAGVYSIANQHYDPDTMYASTESGIYRTLNKGRTWTLMYETGFSRDNSYNSRELSVWEEDEIGTEISIGNIAVGSEYDRIVYAGSSNGLIVSEDRGVTWERVTNLGLASQEIRHILIDISDIEIVYAATDRGVYGYSAVTESWEKLYRGLTAAEVRYLAVAPSGLDEELVLWAATESGMYKLVPAEVYKRTANGHEELLSRFSHEPTIEEIREVAINYAGVHPDKIKKWHKAAANKAWLPDVRVGYDNGKDWQSSNYFYSTSKEKYVDDDITEGKDSGWSVSLSWELGDLIWNNDQTAIDSRSRYAVQLRDDLLNTVTRLYFERRRMQIGMLMLPLAELRERVEMELRLQELTANIDALTGSYFSKRIGRRESVIQ